MTEKLIIENRTDLPMYIALNLVERVVLAGRVSNGNTEYCYGSLFTVNDERIMVASYKNEKSDRLVVHEYYQQEKE